MNFFGFWLSRNGRGLNESIRILSFATHDTSVVIVNFVDDDDSADPNQYQSI